MLSSTTPHNSADSYYERVDPELKEIMDRDPMCLYLETTNSRIPPRMVENPKPAN